MFRYLEENWTDGLETVREADQPTITKVAGEGKAAADIAVGFSTADVKTAATESAVHQEQVVLAQVTWKKL